jgi:hypothetical protein
MSIRMRIDEVQYFIIASIKQLLKVMIIVQPFSSSLGLFTPTWQSSFQVICPLMFGVVDVFLMNLEEVSTILSSRGNND